MPSAPGAFVEPAPKLSRADARTRYSVRVREAGGAGVDALLCAELTIDAARGGKFNNMAFFL
jgi:hypothetical protein